MRASNNRVIPLYVDDRPLPSDVTIPSSTVRVPSSSRIRSVSAIILEGGEEEEEEIDGWDEEAVLDVEEKENMKRMKKKKKKKEEVKEEEGKDNIGGELSLSEAQKEISVKACCLPRPPVKTRSRYYVIIAVSFLVTAATICLLVFDVTILHPDPIIEPSTNFTMSNLTVDDFFRLDDLVTIYDDSKNISSVTIINNNDNNSSSTSSSSSSVIISYEFDPLAVCNDGTQPGYYYNFYSETGDNALHLHFTPTNSNASKYSYGFHNNSFNKWVIYLAGGGQCWDADTCAGRRGSGLDSSSGLGPTWGADGIFSRDPNINKAFHDANKVFIPYCSSDGWMGDAGASDRTWGLHVRGQRIIRSVIRDLVNSGVITSSSEVLFGGVSAGGRGAMMNVDNVQTYLPKGAWIGALLDSPYYLDMQPVKGGDFIGFAGAHKEIYDRFNVSAIIPSGCQIKYGAESWKCLMGFYRLPFVESPYVVIASQFDTYQLSMNNFWGNNTLTKQFSDLTKTGLRDLYHLPRSNNNPKILLSWSCADHTVSLDNSFSSKRVIETIASSDASYPSMTVNDAVAKLYLQKPNDFQLWLDNCTSTGDPCGSGC